ncbi:hypothetical protein CsSME_00030243 [Camellia sinensis var. sinensis]
MELIQQAAQQPLHLRRLRRRRRLVLNPLFLRR